MTGLRLGRPNIAAYCCSNNFNENGSFPAGFVAEIGQLGCFDVNGDKAGSFRQAADIA